MTKPRSPDDTMRAVREAAAAELPPRRLVLTPASKIEPEPVVWAWEDDGYGRIPAGSLGLFAGREGTGKSSFLIWLAAKITTGTLPGSLHGAPRGVIYLAVEDSLEVHDRAAAHRRRRGPGPRLPGRGPDHRGRHASR